MLDDAKEAPLAQLAEHPLNKREAVGPESHRRLHAQQNQRRSCLQAWYKCPERAKTRDEHALRKVNMARDAASTSLPLVHLRPSVQFDL